MNSSPSDSRSKISAVHLGISGFPVGSAAVNKCMAVYKSIHNQNVDFLIINNRAFHPEGSNWKIDKKGKAGGLDYCYTSLGPYKSTSFFGRRVSGFVGRWREFFLLCRLGMKKKIDVAFYYPTNGSFLELIYYWFLSRVFGFKIIAHYVEYRSSFPHGNHFIEWVCDRLYDKYFMRFVDGVLPISEYLITHLKTKKFSGPMVKVPPLADFKQFMGGSGEKGKYFFYVGTAAYMEAITFILQAFEEIKESEWELHLLVNGNAEQMAEFKTNVGEAKKREKIKCFSNLSYPDLIKKYQEASALLIPLTNSVQDTARFPQKMAEYLASGNPVVTTNFGEVPYYLKDGISALISSEYNAKSFADKMQFVIDHPTEAAAIGKLGQEEGLKYFDLNSYGEQLRKMIDSLMADSKK
jgi:glycosyltransferase involved in cell wall biosynthesis